MWGRGTMRTPPLDDVGARKTPAAPPAPLALAHTPQSSTAQHAAELLERGTVGAGEALVAARPRAANFFGSRGLLIALGLAFATRSRAGPLRGTHAPAARLRASRATALLAGAIALIGSLLRPAAGCPTTGFAAITREGMPRLKRPLTTLQQAKASSATRGSLP